MKGITLNPEGCVDNSQTTTTSAPNSPIAKAEARIEGEKVKSWVNNVMLALAVMSNMVLFSMYLNSQSAVKQAYTDLKTQVWVKQDKDEEKFQKFVAGPYAELSAEVKASEILFSKCKESKP